MVAAPQLAFALDDVTALPVPAHPDVTNGWASSHLGPSSRRALAASGVFSLTLHAMAAALVLTTWQKSDLGVLQEPTPAISMELVASPVFENAPVDVREVQIGSASSVAQEVGNEADSEAKAVSDVKPDESVAPDPPAETLPTPQPSAVATVTEPIDTVIAGPADAEDALPPPAASEKKSEPVPRKDEAPAEKPKKKSEKKPAETKTAKKTDETDAQTKKKGGAAARSNASSAGASRASASKGDAAGYSARVRARVAASKPPGRGLKGTATVLFRVSPSGGLSGVQLTRSSGVAALDQAALATVRRAAPFPAPPPGVWTPTLSFRMPLSFQ
ncbi:TonB family protein [Hyphomicrobium sp. LHD-15]|uniref:energy transducer TonB family protein n=1 Tax=Hyphomicrobium sp. LHD-15 TaxID=3072142 RepID=UPI00281086ED|nr:TonB family protein [Hyphomicrobium sp. LHD-15]MDQ8697684.1 TonB family protein [Hyphomicrobium sp. LHD-15]